MAEINFGKTVTLKQAAKIIVASPKNRYLLRGEPGIGKSSLTATLKELLPRHHVEYVHHIEELLPELLTYQTHELIRHPCLHLFRCNINFLWTSHLLWLFHDHRSIFFHALVVRMILHGINIDLVLKGNGITAEKAFKGS